MFRRSTGMVAGHWSVRRACRQRDTKQLSGVAEMGFAGGPGVQVAMADAVELKSYRNRKSCTIDQTAPAEFSGLFDVPR